MELSCRSKLLARQKPENEARSPHTDQPLSRTIEVCGERFDVASDYHLPVDERIVQKVVETLAARRDADVFICVGDIFDAKEGEDRSIPISSFLSTVARIYPYVLYVPGNHCLRSREEPWASFRLPINVLTPGRDKPLLFETAQNKIVLANLFYDLELIDPLGVGFTTDEVVEFYQSQTTDGQKLLGGRVDLFKAMALKAAKAITPDVTMLVTHTAPHPAAVMFRVSSLTSEHKELQKRTGAQFVSTPEADQREAAQEGVSVAQFLRYWNLKNFVMGSNVLNHPDAHPRDGLVCIHGHNHRTKQIQTSLLNGASAKLISHQPYGGRDPKAWESLLTERDTPTLPCAAMPEGFRAAPANQVDHVLDSAREELKHFAASQPRAIVETVHAYACLMLARQELKRSTAPGRCDFPTLTSMQRTEFFRSTAFTSWVRAEQEVGRPVLWLTDLDKTKAAGDAFTFVWDYRIRKGLFTEQQNSELTARLARVDSLTKVQKGLLQVQSPIENAKLIFDLWQAHEFDGSQGISLDVFWRDLYWPSNIGFSRDERRQFLSEFAPEYAQRVFPGAREEMAALSEAGVIPVVVTHGDVEVAQAVAGYLGVAAENVTGEGGYYSERGIHIGVGDSLVVFDEAWRDKPQSGKLVRFNHWVGKRFGEVEYVVAGFDGDSPASDGGAMLTLRPRLGYFMVDTPGQHDAGRLPSFIDFVRKHSGGHSARFYAVSYDASAGGARP